MILNVDNLKELKNTCYKYSFIWEAMDYLSKNDRFDLSLYNGAEDIMYFCAYVPDDLKSFSNYIYTKGFSQYWIKYSI